MPRSLQPSNYFAWTFSFRPREELDGNNCTRRTYHDLPDVDCRDRDLPDVDCTDRDLPDLVDHADPTV